MIKNRFTTLLLFSIMFMSSCKKQNQENEVSSVLTKWHMAAENAKMDEYFSYFDDGAIFIGTDSTEYWNKEEFYKWSKPYFDRGKAWTLRANTRHIYFDRSGKIAWFDELLFSSAGTWRGSGILMKKEGNWKIKHYVLSVTLPNEKMKEFKELLKK